MTIRIEGQIYKVLEVASKVGAAKMSGVVKTKLINVRSGRISEPHFRLQERLQDLEVERRLMQLLYVEGDTCTFMRPDTFEQVEIPNATLGIGKEFLQPGIEMPVEFFEGEPISVAVPSVQSPRSHDSAAITLTTRLGLERSYARDSVVSALGLIRGLQSGQQPPEDDHGENNNPREAC